MYFYTVHFQLYLLQESSSIAQVKCLLRMWQNLITTKAGIIYDKKQQSAFLHWTKSIIFNRHFKCLWSSLSDFNCGAAYRHFCAHFPSWEPQCSEKSSTYWGFKRLGTVHIEDFTHPWLKHQFLVPWLQHSPSQLPPAKVWNSSTDQADLNC